MGIAEVTPDYVNLITNGQYASRTSNSGEFDTLKQILANAWLTTNKCYLTDRKFTHGLALLMAHYYTSGPKDVAGGGGASSGVIPDDSASGPLTSQTVGDISMSFGDASSVASGSGSSTDSAMAAWLGTSAYGREFMALMKTQKPHPIVT